MNLTHKNNDPSGLKRRHLAGLLALSLLPGFGLAQGGKPPTGPEVQVWKDPNCGCCKDWVVHLEERGLRTQVFDTGNTAVRARLGMPAQFGSCHTALVDGYVIEGHVPATDILRLLKERPQAKGLAVPGMPVGSPGMDGTVYGGRKDPHDVLLVEKNGTSQVFQHYP